MPDIKIKRYADKENLKKLMKYSKDTFATKTELASKANDSDVAHKSGDETIAGTKTFTSTIVGNVTGNASTATKLQTARTINGTGFDGSANITTANWGTTRNISITDGTNTSTAVSVDGSANVSLNLPATIKANLTGNCSGSSGSCTGNAATATKLATARTIALSGAATGTATGFDGSGNITIPVTSLDASKLTGTASVSTTGNAATATKAVSADSATRATSADRASAANCVQSSQTSEYHEIRFDWGSQVSGYVGLRVDATDMGGIVTTNRLVEVYNLLNGKANTSGTYSDLTVGNAGSATNATYANWLRTSSHSDHLFHTEWDGSYFWTYVTAGDGGYRAVRVARSDSSGNADTATKATQDSDGNKITTTYSKNGHTHDDRYYTEAEVNNLLAGKANSSHTHPYIPTSASCNKNWNWSGQGGQPSWLWGGEDGTNMYVYNPSNFSVNYANSAGYATIAANGVDSQDAHWIRFKNGVQICWGYASSGFAFPKPFTAAPAVSLIHQTFANRKILINVGAMDSRNCHYNAYDVESGTYIDASVSYTAFGYWVG